MVRNRGGSCLAIGLTVVAMYGMFLLLTYDFQVVMHYSPTRAGVAFLPLSAPVTPAATKTAASSREARMNFSLANGKERLQTLESYPRHSAIWMVSSGL